MPFGGSGTQAGAPWRASVVRTDAEGGGTLPRAAAGTWVGSWTLHAAGSGAVYQGSLMVGMECSKDLLHATCRTDWRLEKLESMSHSFTFYFLHHLIVLTVLKP